MENKKIVNLRFGRAKYNWLRSRSKQAGFRSTKKSIEAIIDQKMFEELYLQGKFGRQNARQIKGLVKSVYSK